jgi:ABC-2 type transport system ATP-binding protein
MFRLGSHMNTDWDQETALERVSGLSIPLDRKVKGLSGGQQAQVALAMALAKRAPLLVLDEPVASLDPVARIEFMQTLMAAVADTGLTVLVSSHVVSELERICDWVVVLTAGRVQLAGPVDDLIAEHRLLTGPRFGELAELSRVAHRTDSDRHSTVLVRVDPGQPTVPDPLAGAPAGLRAAGAGLPAAPGRSGIRQRTAGGAAVSSFGKGGVAMIWVTWRQHRSEALPAWRWSAPWQRSWS